MAFGGGGFFGSGADQSKNDSSQSSAGAQSQTGEAVSLNLKGGGKKSTTNATVNINQTDHGAMEAGRDISLAALDFSSESMEGALGLSSGAIDLAETSLISQQELADQAIFSQQSLAETAIESTAAGYSDALDTTAAGLFDALDAVTTSSKVNAQHLSEGMSNMLSFAQSANTSEDGQISQGLIKWGALVVAAIFVFPQIAKVIK